MSKETYDDVVTNLVHAYAHQKGLTAERIQELLSFFKGQWEMLQKKYHVPGYDSVAAEAAAGGPQDSTNEHTCDRHSHE